jgi:hypothetical protein
VEFSCTVTVIANDPADVDRADVSASQSQVRSYRDLNTARRSWRIVNPLWHYRTETYCRMGARFEAMLERGTFHKCLSCGEDGIGILRVGGQSVRRRCKFCRFSYDKLLPPIDKKVVYLDQFAISEVYKIKSKTRRPGAAIEWFWQEFERLANKAYLLQQVIFPASNIHNDETIVSPFASDLGLAHEMMSGDTSLEYAYKIAYRHELQYATAYISKVEPPILSTDVDEILIGERNVWLPDMHISANTDYSMFAEGIRANKASADISLQQLAARWATDKPTFDDILTNELEDYASAHDQACRHSAAIAISALESDDDMAFINASQNPGMRQYQLLRRLFAKAGTAEHELHAAVLKFREWPALWQLPTHKIFAYLMAAYGWKISCGQRRPTKAGILNDFNAIAAYGPYVDAMFVDRECAELLKHGRLQKDIKFKAKVYSLATGNEFLDYLSKLAASAPKEVHDAATEVYRLD